MIDHLNQMNAQLSKKVSKLQDKNTRLSHKNEELKTELTILTETLNQKFMKEINSEAIQNEIKRVKDPSSYSALRAILTKMNRMETDMRAMEAELAEEGHKLNHADRLKSTYKTKNKQILGEVQSLRAKVDQLKTQNDFLLNQLDYSERKAGIRNNLGAQGAGEYKAKIRQICDIFRIEDESMLLDSIKTIEVAYQFLPSLQVTVENVFKIVTEENIFDTPINSYNVSEC